MPIEFVKDNLLLIAVAVVSGAMLLWPLVRRGAGGRFVAVLLALVWARNEITLRTAARQPAHFASENPLEVLFMTDRQCDAAKSSSRERFRKYFGNSS